jgi:uncharacterized protein (TIGR02996 family)
MTQDQSFLEAIRAEPDDDALRLIYADWLMEQEGPSRVERGEFIRLQIERGRLAIDDPRREPLQHDERRLLARNWEAWIGPLRELTGNGRGTDLWMRTGFHPDSHLRFRRGFVEKLAVDAEAFLSHWADLLRLTPFRYLQLTGAGPHAARLAQCPALAEVRGLDFTDYYVDPLDGAGMAELARSPYLGRLCELDLYSNNLGNRGVAALATAGWFSQLTFLNLSGNGLSGAGLSALASAPASRLRSLCANNNAFQPAGIMNLASSSLMRNLSNLYLIACELGDEGAEALARLGAGSPLRQLELGGNAITDRGAHALAHSPVLNGVIILGMEGNHLTAEGCRELRSSPHLQSSCHLKLTGNPGWSP